MSLPSPEQLLLLEVALGSGPAARSAWERWRERVVFEDIDGESARLLPLCHKSLVRLGLRDELGGRIAGIYRRSWSLNRLSFRAAARVLAELGSCGIETLVLKGAALAVRTYRDVGARAMNDVDLLIRPARLREAVAILTAAGFTPEHPITDGYVAGLPSVGFRDATGLALDLHWFASPYARWPGIDDDLWSAALPMKLDGVDTLALCATDLLFHVCAHGFASHDPHVRWLADAALILGSETIDWTRFVDLTRRRRLVLPIRVAVDALRRFLRAPIPDEVVATLAACPVPWFERVEYRVQTAARPFTAAKVLLRLWSRHQRSSTERGVRQLAGFPDFLRRAYDLPSVWELPKVGVRRGLRRLRADLGIGPGRE